MWFTSYNCWRYVAHCLFVHIPFARIIFFKVRRAEYPLTPMAKNCILIKIPKQQTRRRIYAGNIVVVAVCAAPKPHAAGRVHPKRSFIYGQDRDCAPNHNNNLNTKKHTSTHGWCVIDWPLVVFFCVALCCVVRVNRWRTPGTTHDQFCTCDTCE